MKMGQAVDRLVQSRIQSLVVLIVQTLACWLPDRPGIRVLTLFFNCFLSNAGPKMSLSPAVASARTV
jgi:hypothetical protein